MQLDLTYNNRKLTIEVDESITVDKFQPRRTDKSITLDDFRAALIDAVAIDFLSSSSLLFVLNDGHRNTPSAVVLEWLYELDKNIINEADFLIACGTHEPPSDEHYHFIFGDLWDKVKDRVSYHDCRDTERLTEIGKDQFDQPVLINKKIFNYDKIFLINSVEPHYFAGFTGGRKSFCPGLADFKTIERNHNLANSLDCAPMKLSGNPMAEHLENILSLIDQKNFMSLQLVYDADKKIDSFYFGGLRPAFRSAVDRASEIYSSKIESQYDLVLMEIKSPLDKNLYQVQKALENSQASVKDNGWAVVVSSCSEGIGSPNFYHLADKWNKDANRPKDGCDHFGSHKLSRVNAIGKRIHAGIFCELDLQTVSKVFYEKVEDIQLLIDKLTKDNKNIRMALVHDAAHMVLKI